MPTALTHLVVGGSIAHLLPRDFPRWRLSLFLAFAAAAPDLDVAAFALGIPYGHPLGHRGFSHSLLAALLFGGIVALMATWNRGLIRRYGIALVMLGFVAVASHGMLDAMTDAGKGIGFFIPFSNERYFFSFRPIETAPVNPARFFSSRGIEILVSEILWVWLPLLAASIVLHVMRWLFNRDPLAVDQKL